MNIHEGINAILIAVVTFIACDKSIWPQEAINPRPFSLYYDTLQFTLYFNEDKKLDRFAIQRPLEQIDFPEIYPKADSLVIPLRGAFNMRFNDSYDEITNILGEQEPPSYTVTDTGIVKWANWDFEDRTRIDLLFLNDSLFLIDSDLKWAILPGKIIMGTAMDSVVAIYGKPDAAIQTKSWFMEPLQILGIDIWLKSPQRVFESYTYVDQNLQLNFTGSNILTDWKLRRPHDKQITRINFAFDSLVIPKTGAFGVFFNASAESVQQALGSCQTYGYVNMETHVLTFLAWHWEDSTYIKCQFLDDSLEVIHSNVQWAKLPNGIQIGDKKAFIIKKYGNPTLADKMGTAFSYHDIHFR